MKDAVRLDNLSFSDEYFFKESTELTKPAKSNKLTKYTIH
jgi:hypothetical protein